MNTRTHISQALLPTFQTAPPIKPSDRIHRIYSNDGKTSTNARIDLETKYAYLLMPTDKFNRRLVSYQANKSAQLHSWLKYKEGFSAQLVEMLVGEFGLRPGHKILDPFAGSATTLLVAKELDLDAVGIEILPVCHLAWRAKSQYRDYSLAELDHVRKWLIESKPGPTASGFKHLTITDSAFPPDQEVKLDWYIQEVNKLAISEPTKQLLQFILMSILEDISFTRKDGQYLRWDSRSLKAQMRDERRETQGKAAFKKFDKGKILDVQAALILALDRVMQDLNTLKASNGSVSTQELIEDSALEVLPQFKGAQFDAVITSPPYCNRYDYTRTYALELAFLGVDEESIKNLRQQLLSCTVESRSKLHQLETLYILINRQGDWQRVVTAIQENSALQEIFAALRTRGKLGELNNKGVITMVEGYFTELAFVIFELERICRKGAQVAIVNDNVRYGGEMIPVDLLMTALAEDFGFQPKHIYVLPQQKGNSSQQMGKYGREANRKSITIWKKP